MDLNSKTSEFGVFGLGVMGSAISSNLIEKGFSISVYNRTDEDEASIVDDFVSEHKDFENIQGFKELKEFVNSLERPRKILLMIKAGPVVDMVLKDLIPLLAPGDVVIDGGNSHYLNTKEREARAKKNGICFIGAGISGGEEGARKGPSLMPGGQIDAYKKVAHILESIAAKDTDNAPCCAYIGPEGAGHFIKMVHNGIEYVEMQLLAEMYGLLSKSLNNEDMANLFESWNQGGLGSYLLEITVTILRKKEGDAYLLDQILDKAGNKGTGSWSSKAAFDLGVPNTMMAGSVFSRYISSFHAERVKMAGLLGIKEQGGLDLEMDTLKNAYRFARLINHQQGFQLMQKASEEYGWNLEFSTIARIWSNGCIIKSELMEELKQKFSKQINLFDFDEVRQELIKEEADVRELLKAGIEQRISLHCFTSAFQYWVDMTTKSLPANLIQAQRDFFGAHTYQRIDSDETEFFHSQWV